MKTVFLFLILSAIGCTAFAGYRCGGRICLMKPEGQLRRNEVNEDTCVDVNRNVPDNETGVFIAGLADVGGLFWNGRKKKGEVSLAFQLVDGSEIHSASTSFGSPLTVSWKDYAREKGQITLELSCQNR